MKKGQDKEFDQFFKTALINNESMRRRYDRLKKQKICVRCGRNPAAKQHKLCEECLAKANEYQHEYRTKSELKERAAHRRKIRQERINQGLCVTCGRKLFAFDKNYRECRICREKTNRRYRKRAERRREVQVAESDDGKQADL